jgi:hypothetical protein
MNEKLMYFATGDGANSSGEAYVTLVSKFRGAHPVSSTTLDLVFDSTYGNRDDADYFDYVRLTIVSNTHKAVLESINGIIITKKGNLAIVCDSDNSSFCNSNITDCSIFLNQSTVDSSIVPGIGKQVIAVDQNIRFAHSGDNTVIVELNDIKVPAKAIITRVAAVVKTLSNLATHEVNIQMSAASGTAVDTIISSGTELLGGGVANTDSTDSASASDISLGTSASDLKDVFVCNDVVRNGTSDQYVYVCNAGTGNGTTNSTTGTLTVIIEYYGID